MNEPAADGIMNDMALVRRPLPSLRQIGQQLRAARPRLRPLLREIYELDMRRTWYAIAGMIAIGVFINLLLPHGWTVWPVVFVVGVMAMVHEAAERNGQGIPPLHIYAAVLAALALWVIGAFLFSVINPLIHLAGLAGIGYLCARGLIQQRERRRLIAERRQQGRCIYCGTLVNPEFSFCENCGEDPDPDQSRLERVAGVVRTRNNAAQARATLAPKPPTASVAAREQALIARHHARRPR